MLEMMLHGLATALAPLNMLFVFLGVVFGMVAWAIPQHLRGHLGLVQFWNFNLGVRPCKEHSQARSGR